MVFIDLEEEEEEFVVGEQEEEEMMTSHVEALTPKLHVNVLHNVQTN